MKQVTPVLVGSELHVPQCTTTFPLSSCPARGSSTGDGELFLASLSYELN